MAQDAATLERALRQCGVDYAHVRHTLAPSAMRTAIDPTAPIYCAIDVFIGNVYRRLAQADAPFTLAAIVDALSAERDALQRAEIQT